MVGRGEGITRILIEMLKFIKVKWTATILGKLEEYAD